MRLEAHLDKLKSFTVIAEVGKMREASKILNITQPALTRLVQTLEQAIGTQLLYRSRSGVVPTEAGKVLVSYSQLILNKLQDAEEKMLRPTSNTELVGHLQVGSYISLAEYLWPKFIVDFQKKEPNLKVSIQTAEKLNFEKALEQGVLDLVVDAEPRVVGDFKSWKLYEDRFSVYANKRLDISNIKNMSLIYCPHAFDEKNLPISYHLQAAGLVFRNEIKLDSFPSTAAFAKAGAGLAVLPNRLATELGAGRELLQIELPGLKKEFGKHAIYATIQSERSSDPGLKKLVSSLKQWFKE